MFLQRLVHILRPMCHGTGWSAHRAQGSRPDDSLETRGTAPDLGTVLVGNNNITTYTALIKNHSEILLELPSYQGVTIIAPDDDAFKKVEGWDPNNSTMVTSMLQYHILQGTVHMQDIPTVFSTFAPSLLINPAYTNVTAGQNVIINQQPGDTVVFTTGDGSRSTLLYEDIPFSGGLVQIVDTLLVIPSRLEHTALDAYTDLTAFLAALYAAGLVELLASSPNVTIFAPRNAAFQQLAGTLEQLSPSELARLLSYHLVPGQVVPSAHLFNNTNFTTAALPFGASSNDSAPLDLRIIRDGNNMYVNSAEVVQPDILIANGVVHMIDNVLDPNATAAEPNPSLSAQPPVLPLTAPTKTGATAPTPFASALPCTADCPITTTSTVATTPSVGVGGLGGGGESRGAAAAVARPICTGVVGLSLGLGLLGAVNVQGFLG